MLEKIKKIKMEDVLCLFIILCPILDMLSFVFRNTFNTSISPSTILRPIIPALASIYIFFKNNIKKSLCLALSVYAIYGVIHLMLYKQILTQSSYGGVISELQYIINYSFMILNLFLYTYIFKDKSTKKIKNSVLIAMGIYIVTIFISIFTGTSSPTYLEEGQGYKGWFESGNSLCAILCFGLCICVPLIKNKKLRYITILVSILIGIFLTTLVGTRTGLFGFILVIALYMFAEIFVNIIKKSKLDSKIIIVGFSIIAIVGIIAVIFGSQTLERRQHLKHAENDIIDSQTGEIAHITGDLLNFKNQIERGEMSESFMSKSAQQSILDLYEYAEKVQLPSTDMRMQQLVYNFYLVKNEHDIVKILFGDGFKAQFRELIMEMEIPSFLFNFGIIGFLLYIGPFIVILVYGFYIAIKNLKKINVEYIMILVGVVLSFVLSFLAGYVFFNTSSAIMVVVMNALLLNEINVIKKEEV